MRRITNNEKKLIASYQTYLEGFLCLKKKQKKQINEKHVSYFGLTRDGFREHVYAKWEKKGGACLRFVISLSWNVSIFVSEIGEGDWRFSLSRCGSWTYRWYSLYSWLRNGILSHCGSSMKRRFFLSVDFLESEGKCIVVFFNHACLD